MLLADWRGHDGEGRNNRSSHPSCNFCPTVDCEGSMTGLLCRARCSVEFYVWKGCRRLARACTHSPLWATCETLHVSVHCTAPSSFYANIWNSLYSTPFFQLTYILRRIYFQRKLYITARSRESAPVATMCTG